MSRLQCASKSWAALELRLRHGSFFFYLDCHRSGLLCGQQDAWTVVGPGGRRCARLCGLPGRSRSICIWAQPIAGSTNRWMKAQAGIGWQSWAATTDSSSTASSWIPRIPPRFMWAAWKNSNRRRTVDQPRWRPQLERAGAVQRAAGARSCAGAFRSAHCSIAGTLEGVFRSSDGGATWAEISPPGSHEIHEIESLAVDPGDPDIGLRRNLAPAMEDGRRRQNLAQHQAGTDCGLRRVFDHRRPRASAHCLPERMQRNLQERKCGNSVPQDSGHSVRSQKNARA